MGSGNEDREMWEAGREGGRQSREEDQLEKRELVKALLSPRQER